MRIADCVANNGNHKVQIPPLNLMRRLIVFPVSFESVDRDDVDRLAVSCRGHAFKLTDQRFQVGADGPRIGHLREARDEPSISSV